MTTRNRPRAALSALLDVVPGAGLGEDETQVPVSVREREDPLPDRNGDRQAGDPGHGRGVSAALDRAEHPGRGTGSMNTPAGRARSWPNGVKLRLHRCKIACVARRGQQVVAGDRLPDRIGIGVLAKVFPPDLVDRVVDEAGVREQRKRTLPARVVVYLLLAMVLFFQSGYGDVWDKLVQGLEWARQFRVRVALGMQPSPAAVTQARQRLGWQVMAAAAGGGGRAAGRGGAGDGLRGRDAAGRDRRDVPGRARHRRRTARSSAIRATTPARGRSRRSGSSAWASAGPGPCWGRSCRRWPPGSSRWP